MNKVMIVADRQQEYMELSCALLRRGASIAWAQTGEGALNVLTSSKFDFVITEENLSDMSGYSFIERMVQVNPFINSAVISRLNKDEFHDVSEGLGVLMAVDPEAQEKSVCELFEKLDVLNKKQIM